MLVSGYFWSESQGWRVRLWSEKANSGCRLSMRVRSWAAKYIGSRVHCRREVWIFLKAAVVRDSVSSTQHPGLTSSLLYGMVQLDTGLTRAGVRGRMIPSKLVPVWSFLTKTANEALRAIFPVRRTIPFQWLWWLVGLYPKFLMDRDWTRWRSRVEGLPAERPLQVRLRGPPYQGWSRLYQEAAGLGGQPRWEPRRLGPREWLGLPPNPPEKAPGTPPRYEDLVARQQGPVGPLGRAHSEAVSRELSRQCFAQWLAEASGHGDVVEYHVRFKHPPGAFKQCSCGQLVSKGNFFSCPLTTFNNPLAERLDYRALRFSFQLFQSRASQIELLCQAFDAARGQPIPSLRPPRSRTSPLSPFPFSFMIFSHSTDRFFFPFFGFPTCI